MTGTCQNWLELAGIAGMAENGWRKLEIAGKNCKWLEMDENEYDDQMGWPYYSFVCVLLSTCP